ncbi:hypothetical protein M422DRAFT_241145 [Sphaerobolus stellatus SS14]|nr:hypothetical protein M422DRAFT_241145 [Sphaerobolus stellatus SS14]
MPDVYAELRISRSLNPILTRTSVPHTPHKGSKNTYCIDSESVRVYTSPNPTAGLEIPQYVFEIEAASRRAPARFRKSLPIPDIFTQMRPQSRVPDQRITGAVPGTTAHRSVLRKYPRLLKLGVSLNDERSVGESWDVDIKEAITPNLPGSSNSRRTTCLITLNVHMLS